VFDGDGCQQTVGIQLGKEAQQTCVLERNVFRDTNVDVQQLATLWCGVVWPGLSL
jgi:hypothetical protein